MAEASTSTTPSNAINPGKRAPLAALLQLPFGLAGLGYLYLGQHNKAGRAFGVVLILALLNVAAATMDLMTVCKVLGPAIWVIQALTAYDAWLLARAARRGEQPLTDATTSEVLIPLVGGRLTPLT